MNKLNENLYSRQLYVLGSDAMKQLQQSTCLIIGQSGLGQEVAKNVILAGLYSVTLFDPRPVCISDLSSGFYFTSQSVNERRDFTVLHKMKELNPYVDVSVLPYDKLVIDDDFLKFIFGFNFSTVVVCGLSYDDQQKLCGLPFKFISCQVNGLFSQVFCDFKNGFLVSDVNGEPCLAGIINDITEDGILTVIEGERHNLVENTKIKVTKHLGDEELGVFRVKQVLSAYKVQLDGVFEFFQGGYFVEVKSVERFDYLRLEEALLSPKILDLGHEKKAQVIHNCYLMYKEGMAVQDYKNRLKDLPFKVFCEEVVSVFIEMYDTEIMPMVSIIGGFVAQEVLKSCSGKFTPLNQFMYFDSLDCLNFEYGGDARQQNDNKESDGVNDTRQQKDNKESEGVDNTGQDYKESEGVDSTRKQNGNIEHATVTSYDTFSVDYLKTYKTTETSKDSRYFSYLKVFGKDNFENIKNASIFIVGAGAIGCEHLKNIAMSGFCLNKKVHLTDMDSIEQSNLNRQFLFRQKDVGKMKSEIASRETVVMNSDLKGKISSYSLKVGAETEEVFSDMFYSSLTLVANALDNIEARNYVDSRIVLNCVPLFESGTLGTKGNTQVILPYKTESYASSSDPPEKSIPMCTLRNFPHLIEHTIEFALSEFKSSFNDKIISIHDYLAKEDHESIKNVNIGEDILDLIRKIPENTENVLNLSFDLFYSLFYVSIKKLLLAFPENHVTEEGMPFWSAPKRAPVVVEFDASKETHVLFVLSACFLYMQCFSLDFEIDEENVLSYFERNKNIIKETADRKVESCGSINNDNNNDVNKISSNDDNKHTKNNADINLNNVSKNDKSSQLSFSLADTVSLHLKEKLSPVDFEKDDDSNHHVDFLYACANIRANNYKIKEATRLMVKGIAGRIIPAIATTTSIVSGLSVLEMYKYVFNCKYESFKNTYLTLALPLIASSEPLEPLLNEYYFAENGPKYSYKLWDRIEFDDMTIKEFNTHMKSTYKGVVNMISCNGCIIWSDFFNKERYSRNLDKMFKEICKTSVGMKYLVLDCVFDSECENFPYIVIKI